LKNLLIHLIADPSGMDTEIASLVFLPINTTRARIDMAERLSKFAWIKQADRNWMLETP